MTEREIAYAAVIEQCYAALREVQPQIRGALPAQSVQYAIERVNRLAEQSNLRCQNCGERSGLTDVCADCDAERREWAAGDSAEIGADEALRRQRANAASIADGGWVLYPGEY